MVEQNSLQPSLLAFLIILLVLALTFLYSTKLLIFIFFLSCLNVLFLSFIALLHSSFHHGIFLFFCPAILCGIYIVADSIIKFVIELQNVSTESSTIISLCFTILAK